jgi:bifunctional UDP-N-acetylglucosamine pyrophosphorylase/glucosamine-1-phosphate N-acetyltransferase
MTTSDTLAVVLAAGEGTRMRSALPKVLHRVGGRPMLQHVLAAAEAAGLRHAAVVVGAGGDEVARAAPAATPFVQSERLGTAHAVLAAEAALAGAGEIVVLYGDTPLVRAGTIAALLGRLREGVDIAVLGFEARDPTGYGRLVIEDGRLSRIVEERDADAAAKTIRLCNSGIMAFRAGLLPGLLRRIGNANAKGEYYLTDAVEIAASDGLAAAAVVGEEAEFLGVNDRVQLAAAEAEFQRRARHEAMLGGATLVAPETVFFSADTKLGRDVVVEPNVVFAPGVRIDDGATIRAFSHLEGAHVATGAIIGPYARLRPGADIGANAHIGNFVEVKNADIAEGAKINHLTYIGDASVGARTNVGAGTITVNYDGVFKHRTEIGADAFVGSHSTLIAPVSIGDGAHTAAGSVITESVPADALAFGRARQVTKEGRAVEVRARLKAAKAAKGK